MATTREIPELTSEFVEMSTEYLRQETVGRAKEFGRYAGLGFAAAGLAALGLLLLTIAAVRGIRHLLPEASSHQIWSGFGYLLAALIVAGITGLIVTAAARR
jgi:hypothetical protein